MEHTTLISVIQHRKELEDRGITFIGGHDEELFLSYKTLYTQALKVLGFLQKQGLEKGDELVFQIEDNLTFVRIFWACILGGIIPIPVSVSRNDPNKYKLDKIWSILEKPWLIMPERLFEKLKSRDVDGGEGTVSFVDSWINAEDILSNEELGEIYPAQADDIAFIQFSSGSTGSPKGVVLTHKNLITNISAISVGGAYESGDSLISWMPLTHDMGLIGFHLNPLYCGLSHYIIPTSLFVRRPTIWLDKVSEHKATVLCSPNFGFHYLLKHSPPEDKINWNLGSVRLIYNGAEPISEKLCHEFLDRMESFGLERKTMCPVYGLAEASLAVSISDLDREFTSLSINRNTLNFGSTVSETTDDTISLSFACVGREIPDCQIRICDRKRQAVQDLVIGQIEIKGDNVTAGYYNNPRASKAVISEDGWLYTGDLGFMKNGNLYITGRDKDILFVNGQNYYPHDIERIAEEVEGIDLNKIAVVGSYNPNTEKEEVIGFVFFRSALQKFIPLYQSLQAHVNQHIGFGFDHLIPVKSIPKTTSGKIQRFKLLEDFKSGAFEEVRNSLVDVLEEDKKFGGTLVSPANTREEELLSLFEQVLGISPISVEAKFFDIGGNSLKAAELSMVIRKKFGLELPFDILYKYQSIRMLAQEFAILKKHVYKPIPSTKEKGWSPVSAAQSGIFYAWELDKSSLSYNMPQSIQLLGPLDAEKLARAFEILISRHEILRAKFRLNGAPQWKVAQEHNITLKTLISNSSEVEQLRKSLVEAFDLTTGPLIRARLIRLEEENHLLFLDAHHIISDGISISELLRELWAHYSGEKLEEPIIQYKDYVNWDLERIPALSPQRDFWLDHLKGDLPILNLPIDKSRPAIFSRFGDTLSIQLGVNMTANLKALAHTHQCTLHTLMFALYNLLLYKYTGQDDSMIGIPVSGRSHPDLQHIQGMLVNNLPIRTSVNGEDTFVEMLRKTKRLMGKVLANQDYPFTYLLQDLAVKRDVSRNPIFDTMFVFQNMGFPDTRDDKLKARLQVFNPGISKYDLSMEVFDKGHTLSCSLEYASALFCQGTIQNMLKGFKQLIKEVLDKADLPIHKLSPMTSTELADLIFTYNDTTQDFPEKSALALFEEQALRSPLHNALEYRDSYITYRDLNKKADILAARLQEQGLRAGDKVCLLMDRSPALIESILAVWKSGACYIPIDIDLPEERIRYIISDTDCALSLVDATHKQLFSSELQVNLNESQRIIVHKNNLQNLEFPSAVIRKCKPEDIAYIIYTSGTTGNPKGVMISQRSLVNYITWAAKEYVNGGPGDFPLFTSISFDLTITSIFTPLITGNTLVIYGNNSHQMLLEQIIKENKVDIIKLTPSHLRILARQAWVQKDTNYRVRGFIVGGEELTSSLSREIHDKFTGEVEIFNEYGPTEATVGCMIEKFQYNSKSSTVPIGFPAQNTQIYVLDKHLHPVPTGVHGELYISGRGVAQGYLNLEELSREKFIPNPFIPGQKIYKTGDIVYRLANGKIVYVGRRDHQIKINGYRIELSEIENHLKQHTGIEEAVVFVPGNRDEKKSIYAYYTPVYQGGETRITEKTLRGYLAEKLPHYMMPHHYIELDTIPLTSNGKVNYAALPLENLEPQALLPKGSIEQISLQVWEDVLGYEKLQVTDNFFELGGDSIKAIQISSRLLDVGINLDTKYILTYHTIEHCSQYATEIHTNQLSDQGVVRGEMGLSPISEWFFAQKFPNTNYYNQSVLLELHEPLEREVLSTAFSILIERHDGLRLNYQSAKNCLFFNEEHLEKKFEVEVQEIGINTRPIRDLNVVGDKIKAGFNIEKDLLIKAVILSDPLDSDLLLITAHHLIIDGVSWRILLEELHTLYLQLKRGESPELGIKTASLLEWDRYGKENVPEKSSAETQSLWIENETTDFSIPQDFETEDWRVKNMRKISTSLGIKQTSNLINIARTNFKTDLNTLLSTALSMTIKEWAGTNTSIIEYEDHGRHLPELNTSKTIGWFTNMYPVKLVLPDRPLPQQLSSIKEQLLGIQERRFTQGIQTQQRISPKRSEIRFNFLGQFGKEMDNELFTWSPIPHGKETDSQNHMTTKLEMISMLIHGAYHLDTYYNSQAHSETSILAFNDLFIEKLEQILDMYMQDDTVYFSPSDFDAANLDQEELDALFS